MLSGSQQDFRNFIAALEHQERGVFVGQPGRDSLERIISWCEQWSELAVDEGLKNLHPRDCRAGSVAIWGETDELIDAGVGIRISVVSVGNVEAFYIQDASIDDVPATPISYRVFATNPDTLAAMGYTPTIIREGQRREDAHYIKSITETAPAQSPKYPDWQKMDRQQQNAALKQSGYKWTKFTSEWLEDNDDFETTPGWHLYAPDRREVDVAQAFDEINRGRDTVLAEIKAQNQADKLNRERRRQIRVGIEAISQYICEHGEKPETNEFPTGETLLDSRNIYGSGDAFVIEPDNAIWFLVKNGMDGDNWSRNNLPGHIAYRLPANETIATNLRQLAVSLKGE